MSSMSLETLAVRVDGPVVFAEIAAPPMNLLGPELVRDLVSLIQWAEADAGVQVLVFSSADPDYFISHVDVTRIAEYRAEAAKLTGESPIARRPNGPSKAEHLTFCRPAGGLRFERTRICLQIARFSWSGRRSARGESE
jgi:enoyl-CoA hydratase/carnithine racemase